VSLFFKEQWSTVRHSEDYYLDRLYYYTATILVLASSDWFSKETLDHHCCTVPARFSTGIDFDSTNYLNRFESQQQQQQPIWKITGAATSSCPGD
jgi:hypothetical protein